MSELVGVALHSTQFCRILPLQPHPDQWGGCLGGWLDAVDYFSVSMCRIVSNQHMSRLVSMRCSQLAWSSAEQARFGTSDSRVAAVGCQLLPAALQVDPSGESAKSDDLIVSGVFELVGAQLYLSSIRHRMVKQQPSGRSKFNRLVGYRTDACTARAISPPPGGVFNGWKLQGCTIRCPLCAC